MCLVIFLAQESYILLSRNFQKCTRRGVQQIFTSIKHIIATFLVHGTDNFGVEPGPSWKIVWKVDEVLEIPLTNNNINFRNSIDALSGSVIPNLEFLPQMGFEMFSK